MNAGGDERILVLITPTASYDGFGDVDIVVEAVFENMDLKKSMFAELNAVTHPDAILDVEHVDTLDIDELAAASGRETHVVGHHFFSPANVMKLSKIAPWPRHQHRRSRCRESSRTTRQGWRGRR